MKIFLVMLGGSLGALSRYSIALAAAKYLDSRFPLGTLLANLTGCFLINNVGGILFVFAGIFLIQSIFKVK